MLVNGFKLPNAFLQLSQALERGGTSLFLLKEQVDVYGNRFEGGLHLWTADEASRSGTDWLAEHYGTDRMSPEEIQTLNDDTADDPGMIPYLSDFSKIVCFGEEIGMSDPFCFDFRENLQEPSIICVDDWYWRRVAPNFEEFIGLYRPSRFVVSEVEAEKTFGSTPDWKSVLEKHMCSREALAITEEVLSKIQAGREERKAS